MQCVRLFSQYILKILLTKIFQLVPPLCQLKHFSILKSMYFLKDDKPSSWGIFRWGATVHGTTFSGNTLRYLNFPSKIICVLHVKFNVFVRNLAFYSFSNINVWWHYQECRIFIPSSCCHVNQNTTAFKISLFKKSIFKRCFNY